MGLTGQYGFALYVSALNSAAGNKTKSTRGAHADTKTSKATSKTTKVKAKATAKAGRKTTGKATKAKAGRKTTGKAKATKGASSGGGSSVAALLHNIFQREQPQPGFPGPPVHRP
jgi:hypothetical protein